MLVAATYDLPVAAYARYSTNRQDARSIDDQLRRCHTHASKTDPDAKLTAIDGINVLTAQTLIAEVGYDMSRFATEAHFVSYLDLSPRNKISGGKVLKRKSRRCPKCGAKLNNQRTRCKRCTAVVAIP